MVEPSGQPEGVSLIVGKQRMESIGADVDMNLGTYVSRITAYNLAITLNTGTTPDNGKIKKIYNDSSVEIVINCSINVQGAATDTITLADNNAWIELLYLNNPDTTERYREIDGQNYTLS